MNDASDSEKEFSGSIVGPGVEKGPLVDKMSSPAYRKLAAMIAKGRRNPEDLRSLIKEQAVEGHLRPGEAGTLKRELDSAFAPNAEKEQRHGSPQDEVFVDGVPRGQEQKPKLFRKPVAPERKSVPPEPVRRVSQAPTSPKQGYMDMVIVNTRAGVGVFTRRK